MKVHSPVAKLKRPNRLFGFVSIVLLLTTVLVNQAMAEAFDHVVLIEPTSDLQYRLQEEIIKAKPNTLIRLPEGMFQFTDEIVLDVSHITLRGKGMDKTILSFKGQPSGAQGMLVLADAFTAEDFAIEDTAGDGLRVEEADGVVIRRVRVEWTNGPDANNGSYGLYPVLCNNVLIEDSVAIGASDAGIYVGQSNNIVVRRNLAEYNVAGIEIENSTYADVYKNIARNNTGGILIFDLPGLTQSGHHTRVYKNLIQNNNTPNFAPAGNIVGTVPSGTGMMVMATDDVDIYRNLITGNKTAGVIVTSYVAVSVLNGQSVPEGFDPFPKNLNIRRNVIHRPEGVYRDGSDINSLINGLHIDLPQGLLDINAGLEPYGVEVPVPQEPVRFAEVVYDGITPGIFDGTTTAADMNICLRNNTAVSESVDVTGWDKKVFKALLKGTDEPVKISDVQLAKTTYIDLAAVINPQLAPYGVGIPGDVPGGPVLIDRTPHDCKNEKFAGVILNPFPPVPPVDDVDYAEEEITALCNAEGTDVNWGATVVNCTDLASYRLFDDVTDPTQNANGGFPYDLTTPLFSDYASKYRFIYVPTGNSAQYNATGILDFPVGSVLAKTFSIAPDLNLPGENETIIETRLLIHRESGWVGLPYTWSEDMSSATLALGGGRQDITFVDYDGQVQNTSYGVPNANQCSSCHTNGDVLAPIGPKARLLNKDTPYVGQVGEGNQLSLMSVSGLLAGLPADVPYTPVWNDMNEPLEGRAKAYLDTNCAHCHSGGGRAKSTGLYLNEDMPVSDPAFGLCKPPVAAGLGSGGFAYDIVPGSPETSILHYRMESTDPAIRMPELGRTLNHKEGSALIGDWIRSVTGTCGE